MARRFKGLSAFPITPADEAGRVDVEAFSALIERLDVAAVDSVGILGSTGIYMYLTREERRRAIEAAAAILNGRRTLMAGVGALRTDEAVALARDAEAAGADALLLAPVFLHAADAGRGLSPFRRRGGCDGPAARHL